MFAPWLNTYHLNCPLVDHVLPWLPLDCSLINSVAHFDCVLRYLSLGCPCIASVAHCWPHIAMIVTWLLTYHLNCSFAVHILPCLPLRYPHITSIGHLLPTYFHVYSLVDHLNCPLVDHVFPWLSLGCPWVASVSHCWTHITIIVPWLPRYHLKFPFAAHILPWLFLSCPCFGSIAYWLTTLFPCLFLGCPCITSVFHLLPTYCHNCPLVAHVSPRLPIGWPHICHVCPLVAQESSQLCSSIATMVHLLLIHIHYFSHIAMMDSALPTILFTASVLPTFIPYILPHVPVCCP